MLGTNELLQGRYKITRQLGQGGMGAVYEAEDAKQFGKTVALKEILTVLANEFDMKQHELFRNAFEREAKILMQVDHEAFPQVIDYFSESSRQFLVMQLIQGRGLNELLIKRQSAFPTEQVCNWADQLLDALDYLHTLDPPIIHRDIKPQNLKLTNRGKIRLLDFGIAKGMDPTSSVTITNATMIAATLHYSPSEQLLRVIDPITREALQMIYGEKMERILEQNADLRSDVYSLAATLYHLMTNKQPVDSLKRTIEFWRENPDNLIPPNEINPAIPQEISDWLVKAMAIDRDKRYSSALEMRDALHSAAAGESQREEEISRIDVQEEQEKIRIEREELKLEREKLEQEWLELQKKIEFEREQFENQKQIELEKARLESQKQIELEKEELERQKQIELEEEKHKSNAALNTRSFQNAATVADFPLEHQELKSTDINPTQPPPVLPVEPPPADFLTNEFATTEDTESEFENEITLTETAESAPEIFAAHNITGDISAVSYAENPEIIEQPPFENTAVGSGGFTYSEEAAFKPQNEPDTPDIFTSYQTPSAATVGKSGSNTIVWIVPLAVIALIFFGGIALGMWFFLGSSSDKSAAEDLPAKTSTANSANTSTETEQESPSVTADSGTKDEDSQTGSEKSDAPPVKKPVETRNTSQTKAEPPPVQQRTPPPVRNDPPKSSPIKNNPPPPKKKKKNMACIFQDNC